MTLPNPNNKPTATYTSAGKKPRLGPVEKSANSTKYQINRLLNKADGHKPKGIDLRLNSNKTQEKFPS